MTSDELIARTLKRLADKLAKEFPYGSCPEFAMENALKNAEEEITRLKAEVERLNVACEGTDFIAYECNRLKTRNAKLEAVANIAGFFLADHLAGNTCLPVGDLRNALAALKET